MTRPAKHLDELDAGTVALWYAAVSLGEVRRKGNEGRPVNVRRDDGEWVAMRAERVEAIGASVTMDADEDVESDDESSADDELVTGIVLDDIDWGPVH